MKMAWCVIPFSFSYLLLPHSNTLKKVNVRQTILLTSKRSSSFLLFNYCNKPASIWLKSSRNNNCNNLLPPFKCNVFHSAKYCTTSGIAFYNY